jgi:hypothetical protein
MPRQKFPTNLRLPRDGGLPATAASDDNYLRGLDLAMFDADLCQRVINLCRRPGKSNPVIGGI